MKATQRRAVTPNELQAALFWFHSTGSSFAARLAKSVRPSETTREAGLIGTGIMVLLAARTEGCLDELLGLLHDFAEEKALIHNQQTQEGE